MCIYKYTMYGIMCAVYKVQVHAVCSRCTVCNACIYDTLYAVTYSVRNVCVRSSACGVQGSVCVMRAYNQAVGRKHGVSEIRNARRQLAVQLK